VKLRYSVRAGKGRSVMAKKILTLTLVAAFLAGAWLIAGAQEAKKEAKETYTLVGVKNCKMCHNKEATGAQFTQWSETLHAKAFETLGGDKAKAKAKELGLGNPQEEDKCLKCHVTAFPVKGDLENQKITMEEGVSCESCHGPGSGYKSKKTMEDLLAGTIEPASVGLWMPDEKLCVTCHNPENPFHKEFKFDEYVKKIAHPIPKGE
jgi:cytochrome c peroxidase